MRGSKRAPLRTGSTRVPLGGALLVVVVLLAGCHRYTIVLDRPAALQPQAQVRNHAYQNIIEDAAVAVDAHCDGRVAKIEQRRLWYVAAVGSDIHCVTPAASSATPPPAPVQ